MKWYRARKAGIVATMEFRMAVLNKTFLFVTLLGPFLIVAMSVLPGLLASRGSVPEGTRIAIIGNAPQFAEELAAAFSDSPIEAHASTASRSESGSAVQNGALDGYLVLPETPLSASSISFYSSGGTEIALIGTIDRIVGRTVAAGRLRRAGFDPQEVNRLSVPPEIVTKRVDSGADVGEESVTTAIFTTITLTMMLYMTILLYGQAIGRSVLKEKTGKTVEILLSSVRPGELLVGKILGRATAGLLQYAIWVLVAVVVLNVVGPLVGYEFAVAGGAETYAYLVLFFVLAFFLYATVYAALGAASEDEQNLSQLAMPFILFLVVPMVLLSATIAQPDGTLPRLLSYFPFTAPIVMFQRLIIGNPRIWEVVVSIGMIIATSVVISWFAARVFRVGILMTGKRYSYREITRWFRYRG